MKKLRTLMLVLLLGPIALYIVIGTIAAAAGCQVNEAGPHPCSILGIDMSNFMYVAGMLLIIAAFQAPFVLAILSAMLIFWLVCELFSYLTKRRA